MTDNDLKNLLADYAAPTADQGFSDALMQTIHCEADQINLSDYARPRTAWRTWVVALTLGVVSGLLWTWIGVKLPDFTFETQNIGLLQSGWGAYAIAAICMAVGLIFVELDTA